MPKIGQAKKPAQKAQAKAKVLKKAPANSTKKAARIENDMFIDDPAVFWSDEDDEQQEIVIILGEIGSGKTYAAGTASDFWPHKYPAPRRVVLEDMFWLQADRKATAGFKGDKIKVATFDFMRFMSFPDVYEKYGYNNPPNFSQATTVGLQKAEEFVNGCYEKGLRPKICGDTRSGWDDEHFQWAEEEDRKQVGSGAKIDHYRKWAIHGGGHRLFFSSLVGLGADVIFCCHQTVSKTDSKGGKDKAIAVEIAGMEAEYVPDLLGAVGPKIYKRHTSMQLIMRAYRGAGRDKNKITREILIGVNDFGGEAKNRYERALAAFNGVQSPPDLGEIFRMVRK